MTVASTIWAGSKRGQATRGVPHIPAGEVPINPAARFVGADRRILPIIADKVVSANTRERSRVRFATLAHRWHGGYGCWAGTGERDRVAAGQGRIAIAKIAKPNRDSHGG